VTTNQLGTVDSSGLTDIIYNDSLEGGDFKFYQFTVPPERSAWKCVWKIAWLART